MPALCSGTDHHCKTCLEEPHSVCVNTLQRDSPICVNTLQRDITYDMSTDTRNATRLSTAFVMMSKSETLMKAEQILLSDRPDQPTSHRNARVLLCVPLICAFLNGHYTQRRPLTMLSTDVRNPTNTSRFPSVDDRAIHQQIYPLHLKL